MTIAERAVDFFPGGRAMRARRGSPAVSPDTAHERADIRSGPTRPRGDRR